MIGKFVQTVVRCRPIAQVAAEQLLLDVAALKSTLLILPQTDESPVPQTFVARDSVRGETEKKKAKRA